MGGSRWRLALMEGLRRRRKARSEPEEPQPPPSHPQHQPRSLTGGERPGDPPAPPAPWPPALRPSLALTAAAAAAGASASVTARKSHSPRSPPPIVGGREEACWVSGGSGGQAVTGKSAAADAAAASSEALPERPGSPVSTLSAFRSAAPLPRRRQPDGGGADSIRSGGGGGGGFTSVESSAATVELLCPRQPPLPPTPLAAADAAAALASPPLSGPTAPVQRCPTALSGGTGTPPPPSSASAQSESSQTAPVLLAAAAAAVAAGPPSPMTSAPPAASVTVAAGRLPPVPLRRYCGLTTCRAVSVKVHHPTGNPTDYASRLTAAVAPLLFPAAAAEDPPASPPPPSSSTVSVGGGSAGGVLAAYRPAPGCPRTGGIVTVAGCVQLIAWSRGLEAAEDEKSAAAGRLAEPELAALAAAAGLEAAEAKAVAAALWTQQLQEQRAAEGGKAAAMAEEAQGPVPFGPALEAAVAATLPDAPAVAPWAMQQWPPAAYDKAALQLPAAPLGEEDLQERPTAAVAPLLSCSAEALALPLVASRSPSSPSSLTLSLSCSAPLTLRLLLLRRGELVADCTAHLDAGSQILHLPVPAQYDTAVLQLLLVPPPPPRPAGAAGSSSDGGAPASGAAVAAAMPVLLYDTLTLLAVPSEVAGELNALVAVAAGAEGGMAAEQRAAVWDPLASDLAFLLERAELAAAAAGAEAQAASAPGGGGGGRLPPPLLSAGGAVEALRVAANLLRHLRSAQPPLTATVRLVTVAARAVLLPYATAAAAASSAAMPASTTVTTTPPDAACCAIAQLLLQSTDEGSLDDGGASGGEATAAAAADEFFDASEVEEDGASCRPSPPPAPASFLWDRRRRRALTRRRRAGGAPSRVPSPPTWDLGARIASYPLPPPSHHVSHLASALGGGLYGCSDLSGGGGGVLVGGGGGGGGAFSCGGRVPHSPAAASAWPSSYGRPSSDNAGPGGGLDPRSNPPAAAWHAAAGGPEATVPADAATGPAGGGIGGGPLPPADGHQQRATEPSSPLVPPSSPAPPAAVAGRGRSALVACFLGFADPGSEAEYGRFHAREASAGDRWGLLNNAGYTLLLGSRLVAGLVVRASAAAAAAAGNGCGSCGGGGGLTLPRGTLWFVHVLLRLLFSLSALRLPGRREGLALGFWALEAGTLLAVLAGAWAWDDSVDASLRAVPLEVVDHGLVRPMWDQIRLRLRLPMAVLHSACIALCEARHVRPTGAWGRLAATLLLAAAVGLALELPRRRAFLRQQRQRQRQGQGQQRQRQRQGQGQQRQRQRQQRVVAAVVGYGAGAGGGAVVGGRTGPSRRVGSVAAAAGAPLLGEGEGWGEEGKEEEEAEGGAGKPYVPGGAWC
ncbi:hypothetical protein HYH03_013444 [Edaphochlamys debaryana]|uniref:Uncharacterized protein n=1 Tax=Edaphochlamys debaryana TaxID=47281 RepID=A0A836BTE1_9CHLO|nr:hypothetical protein HYH03_013444 [Edaphochlamys debaryana]|eukprot:KAG2488007.1 hypothetical protein HYH03_013444 [Edaphochlamys debaryana]